MNTVLKQQPVDDIVMRSLEEKDFKAFLALSTIMHQESEYRNLAFSEQRVKQFFDLHLTDPAYAGWVVEVDGNLVAGFLAQYNHISQFSDDRVAFENGFFVHPAYRCQGIAKQLFTIYEQWAKGNGCRYTYCSVTTEIDEKKTVARLEKQGYQRCGTLLKKDFL